MLHLIAPQPATTATFKQIKLPAIALRIMQVICGLSLQLPALKNHMKQTIFPAIRESGEHRIWMNHTHGLSCHHSSWVIR